MLEEITEQMIEDCDFYGIKPLSILMSDETELEFFYLIKGIKDNKEIYAHLEWDMFSIHKCYDVYYEKYEGLTLGKSESLFVKVVENQRKLEDELVAIEITFKDCEHLFRENRGDK